MERSFLTVISVMIGFANAVPFDNARFSFANPHIVGGGDVTINLPYQISIRVTHSGIVSPTELRHYCGGTLIQPNIVLTAAHCFDDNHLQDLQKGNIYVVAGTKFLRFNPSTTFVTPVTVAIKHHEHGNVRGNSHDVAILKLFKSAPIDGTTITVLPLRTSSTNMVSKCVISGWGTTEYGVPHAANCLQSAVVPILPTSECEKKYRVIGYQITPDMICAGLETGGVDSCQGDSGGPLACDGQLTGIVSWGYRCAMPSIPGVYASVSHHKKWIDEAIVKITESDAPEPAPEPAPTKLANNANTKTGLLILIVLSVVVSFQ